MKFLLKKSVYIPVLVLGALALLFLLRAESGQKTPDVAAVTRGSIVQEVTVTGTVKATEAVELAFEKAGRVGRIGAAVGDAVWRGATLVTLENAAETAAVEDAEAKRAAKRARYEELRRGGRPEEVRVKESLLAKAQTDLAADYAAVPTVVLDSFNKADNAIHRQTDTLFSNASSANPRLTFASSDQQSVVNAESERPVMETVLGGFRQLAQEDWGDDTEKERALAQAKERLVRVNSFLLTVNRAINSALNITDATLATHKDALNTARTNVNTALGNVTDQIQAIVAGKATVQTARDELALAAAGATEEVLAQAQADIASADAAVKNARAVLGKTYLTAPISGTVTKQEAKVGEIAGANAVIAAVMSDAFKIEAFVPEVDVAKIAVGNRADVTLDAYGNGVVLTAHVVAIDPAETVIDGVSTYKTTLQFEKPDERIRSGMTANTMVTTATRENALSVPARAVFEKDGKKFVKRVQAGAEEEREVTVGIRGSNGEIEILSGLSEKESVVTSGNGK